MRVERRKYKKTRESQLPEPSGDTFSRRELTLHRIALHFSDVEVQTTNSPHRVAHSGTEGQSLIDTPFSRDPNISIRRPPDESSRSRMGNSGSQHSSISRSPVPSANAHTPRSVSKSSSSYFYSAPILPLFCPYTCPAVFYDRLSFQNYDSTGSIRSRKHAPPPPIPFDHSQPTPPRTTDNYSSDFRSKSNIDSASHDWQYDDRTSKNSGSANRFDRPT